MPASRCSSVLLPEPLGPISAACCPDATEKRSIDSRNPCESYANSKSETSIIRRASLCCKRKRLLKKFTKLRCRNDARLLRWRVFRFGRCVVDYAIASSKSLSSSSNKRGTPRSPSPLVRSTKGRPPLSSRAEVKLLHGCFLSQFGWGRAKYGRDGGFGCPARDSGLW